jgi:hypothetical protein
MSGQLQERGNARADRRGRRQGARASGGLRSRRQTTDALVAIGSAAAILAAAVFVDLQRPPAEQRGASALATAARAWDGAKTKARDWASANPSASQRVDSRESPPRAFRPAPKIGVEDEKSAASGPPTTPRSARVAAVGPNVPVIASSPPAGSETTTATAAGSQNGSTSVGAAPSAPMPQAAPTLTAPPRGSLEVALVIDTSMHVAGEPLAATQRAATTLLEQLMGADEADGDARTRVALVPFAGMVNVGPEHRTARWLGGGHARLALYDRVGIAWPGCVEARRGPHEISAAAPDPLDPATMFVPAFAPDEPDVANSGGYAYANDYLADEGGTCAVRPRACTIFDKRGQCIDWQRPPLDPVAAQANLCKYAPPRTPMPAGKGPAAGCTSPPVAALGTPRAVLAARIAAFDASGDASIVEGLVWGRRLLEPGTVIGRAEPHRAPGNQKVIVLMTAGRNSYPAAANHNGSGYGAHGYAAEERLGLDRSATGLALRLDSRLAEACTAAKEDGVRIVTVLVDPRADPAAALRLSACASTPESAFEVGDDAGRMARAVRSIAPSNPTAVTTGTPFPSRRADRAG